MNGGTPRPHTMEAGEMYNTFARGLTEGECVIPYVEQNFRTINDRGHLPAGFSRGGGQSMYALKPFRPDWLDGII